MNREHEGRGPGYERRDLPRHFLRWALVAFAVGGLLVHEGLRAGYGVSVGHGPYTIDSAGAGIPAPELVFDPTREREVLTARADSLLSQYGWSDRARGIAYIPIERAMELLAEDGPGPAVRETTASGSQEEAPRVAPPPEPAPAGPAPQAPEPKYAAASALERPGERLLQSAELTPTPGARLDPAWTFADARGAPVRFGDLLGDRPAVLVLSYGRCRHMCPAIREDLAGAVARTGLDPGRDFTVIDVSFDPAETGAQAEARRDAYLAAAGAGADARGWRCLTGDPATVAALAKAVGYGYARDPRTGEYAHPAGVMVLTPDGTIARYLLTVPLEPRDLRLALIEAAGGRIGGPVAAIALRCFEYDPEAGGYSFVAYRAMRMASGATVVLLAAAFGAWFWRTRRRREAGAAFTACLPAWLAASSAAPASEYARRVDLLALGISGVTAFYLFAVVALIAAFCIRYRSGSSASREGVRHGNVSLELGWTAVLVAVGAGIFIWSWVLYTDQLERRPDAIRIGVIGRQWMWQFEHPGGRRELAELHVPAHVPIELTLISEDVIHSLFVPALRIKQDALPGRYTTLRFEADRTGELRLTCAEYQDWLEAGAPGATLAAQGAMLFRQLGCGGCHAADGSGLGPSLVGLAGRPVPLASGEVATADRAYLRDAILLPGRDITAGYPNIMPSFSGRVDEAQIMQLLAYLESLGDRTPPPRGGGAP